MRGLRGTVHGEDLMSKPECVLRATVDRFSDVANNIEGVDLRHLPPSTTLLVRTTHSLYRVVTTEGPEVHVQGGEFFPDPTPAYLDGASIGGTFLRVGWIGVGFLVEIRSGGRRFVTSPVCGIVIEPASGSGVW